MKILVGSKYAVDGVGGLAAYQRGLAAELPKSIGESCSADRLVEHVSIRLKGYSRLLGFIAARANWHHFMERVAWTAVGVGVRRVLLEPRGAVHWVGTGWDFGGFAVLKAARIIGARFTVWPAVHPRQWGDDLVDVRLYNNAAAVFCQSSYELEHLAALGVARQKLVRCGLAPMCRADGDEMTFRSRYKIGNRPVVLFIGRRDSEKGYDLLVRAWKIVIKAVPEACLVIAGPSSERPCADLEHLPRENVRDLGVPDEKEKADALATCELLCLPSGYESFGIVYVEAWSYGKAVICGTAPASRELVRDGETGLWADRSPESIATKIIRLLEDRETCKRLGMTGRELQQKTYTWSHVVREHLTRFGFGAHEYGVNCLID